MLQRLRSFFTICLLIFPLLATLPPPVSGADATSFDPTTVAVEAKSVGGVPVGFILPWPVGQNPADFQNTDGSYNWLECNGQSINAAVYPELFEIVGSNIPDYRGLFLRGHGSQGHSQNNGSIIGVTSTIHSSGQLGQIQGDAIRNIIGEAGNWITRDSWHQSGAITLINHAGGWMQSGGTLNRMGFRLDTSRVVPTAEENRPVNKAVRYLIRALP